LTRAGNRGALEAELARRPVPNLHIEYFDLSRRAARWLAGGRLVNLHYYLWQVFGTRAALRLHQRIGFDLAHHVSYVRYWSPSLLRHMPVPVIWGPVGGGESAPRAFWRDFGSKGIASEALRDLARWMAERDPLVRRTARRASLIFATTPETAERIRALGCTAAICLPANGVSAEEVEQLGRLSRPDAQPHRFVSIGRLLHWKGFHLALRAFAQAEIPDAEYWIIGAGPQKKRLESLARSLGIAARVKCFGNLPRQSTMERLARCTALVHPALHDSSPAVCFEAMAAGVPVICLDLGGPAMQVTNETGIRVRATEPAQAIEDLAAAMKRLVENPALGRAMGAAGRRRAVEEFSWRARSAVWNIYYRELVQSGDASPGVQPNARAGAEHIARAFGR
jgi:glycosyltransferase involved in cell wall biosynthesis